MDTYTILRQIADSWVLLAMFGFFVAAAVWAFWPGQRAAREDASMIPFRNEDAPNSGSGDRQTCASQEPTQAPEGLTHDK